MMGDRIENPSRVEDDRGFVLYDVGDVPSDPVHDLVVLLSLALKEGDIALYHVIDLVDMERGLAMGDRHVRVYLRYHQGRLFYGNVGHVNRHAEVQKAAAV